MNEEAKRIIMICASCGKVKKNDLECLKNLSQEKGSPNWLLSDVIIGLYKCQDCNEYSYNEKP